MYKISGLSILYPLLSLAIWFMLVIFFGFPGTLKFFAEFYFLSILAEFNFFIAFIIGFILVFLGSVGFARCWFSILYGHPGYPTPHMDLSREEITIIS
jgi:formate hydrogenlyase subunit 3/multisubunit Na+/H+ antiporter MnhD subunit